jgi:predicted Zn-dependent protease
MPRRRKPKPVLELVPAGAVDPGLISALGADLERSAGVQWRIGEPVPLCDEWRDAESGLYPSVHLMHALIARRDAGDGKGGARWTLAIADAGFCAHPVGPIFGEAEVEGCCAVVGVQPLRRGSGADADVLRRRLLSVALHEVGHLAGGGHCRRASCVMYPSADIADADRRTTAFCPDCADSLKWLGIRKT